MRYPIVAFSVIITSLVLLGCSERTEEVRIDNVVRVFWHEGTRYSLQVRKPNSAEIETIAINNNMCGGKSPRDRIKILADVPLLDSMWVRYTVNFNWNLDCLEALEIHIHSEKDIDGGGWNHGKFGRGQTSVIR